MPRQIQIILDTARLDALDAGLERRALDVLDKIAFDVLRNAQPRTAYDTGALRNSGYVSGASGGSTYGPASSEAQSRRPGAQIMDEVTASNKFERVVAFSVSYAYSQELSRAFLGPAVEDERALAVAAWESLFR